MYRRRSGTSFLERANYLWLVLGLLPLFFSTACAQKSGKWRWVRDALKPVEITKKEPDYFLGEDPLPSKHPFLDPDFQRHLDEASESYLSAGNETKLLADHNSTDAKLALIETAHSSVYIAMHMIICDEGGENFMTALAQAAQRGIDVRVIIDGGVWGAFGGSCPEAYEEEGVKVLRSSYTLLGLGDSMKLHDKIFVVDGEVAITGGQNAGTYWADSTGEDGYFRDTDVWVKGPVVNQIALRFVGMWKTLDPVNHGLEKYERFLLDRSREFADKGLTGIRNYSKWLKSEEPKGLCRFVGQDPHLGNHNVFRVYTELAKASQHHIAFHVPSLDGLGSAEQEALMSALTEAASRPGIQVDVITNGPGLLLSRMLNPTFGYVFGVYTLGRVFESVKDTPINIYVYKYWIHSKVFDFDGLAIAVGSFNFDESGVDWMESTLICMDKELSRKTRDLLARDFANSRLLPKAVGIKKKTQA